MLQELVLVATIASLGGFLKGLTGFGYALVSTGILLSYYTPETAVSLMIIPLIASNLEIVRELSVEEIFNCLDVYSHYLFPLLIGAVAGTFMIGTVPSSAFSVVVGLFVTVYALQKFFRPEIIDHLASRCFTEGRGVQGITGLISGFVFGAANIGVQIVTYIESQDLDHSRFVGMVGLSMIGVSTVRLATAGYLGFFRGFSDLYLSTGMALAGVTATYLGEKAMRRIDPERVRILGIVLLMVIGVRLVTKGLGIV